MRKQDLFKRAAVLALAGALAMGNAMTSFAAGWQWLDENNDGIAECYYFDEGGHKLTGTTTPDGYTVNADGAWVENGAVQTQASSSPAGSGAASSQAGTAGWYHDGIGWKYRMPNGYDAGDTWAWGDRNNDGTAELYYFEPDSKGCYLFDHAGSPTGYENVATVNEEGARMVNGVVLTQPATPVYTPENTYNAQGVSNIALEMVENSREENAKFGEIMVRGELGARIDVTYANGFKVSYSRSVPSDKTISVPVKFNDKLLFQYYDNSLKSAENIADYLHGKGFRGGYGGTYADGDACWVGLDDGHSMIWGENRNVSLSADYRNYIQK